MIRRILHVDDPQALSALLKTLLRAAERFADELAAWSGWRTPPRGA